MKLETVGEIIATRRLILAREGRQPVDVVVWMGKPEKFPDHTDYYCPYRITGFDRDKVMAIGGVAAFPAMQLALGGIRVELEVIEEDSGGRLTWEARAEGDLGFAEPNSE
ncbi:MAG: hypothetical protein WA581_03950 [Candidatus Acidiferrales bacterium]